MTPADEELDQLRKQNAQLLRALMRVKQERDALAKQLAALRSDTTTENVAVAG
jgi:hypothetical protein